MHLHTAQFNDEMFHFPCSFISFRSQKEYLLVITWQIWVFVIPKLHKFSLWKFFCFVFLSIVHLGVRKNWYVFHGIQLDCRELLISCWLLYSADNLPLLLTIKPKWGLTCLWTKHFTVLNCFYVCHYYHSMIQTLFKWSIGFSCNFAPVVSTAELIISFSFTAKHSIGSFC